jgi:hypothetical protein
MTNAMDDMVEAKVNDALNKYISQYQNTIDAITLELPMKVHQAYNAGYNQGTHDEAKQIQVHLSKAGEEFFGQKLGLNYEKLLANIQQVNTASRDITQQKNRSLQSIEQAGNVAESKAKIINWRHIISEAIVFTILLIGAGFIYNHAINGRYDQAERNAITSVEIPLLTKQATERQLVSTMRNSISTNPFTKEPYADLFGGAATKITKANINDAKTNLKFIQDKTERVKLQKQIAFAERWLSQQH